MTIPFSPHKLRVTVTAPARLHMGFVDLNGGFGRRFGSLGLTISNLETVVEAETSSVMIVEGVDSTRALRIAERLNGSQRLPGKARIVIKRAIPAHAGLGSGTQLALAVGSALARLNGWDMSPRAIACLSDRGSRSGIGIGAFETGGFIVDGGRGVEDVPPRIISRLAFPDAWRVVLILSCTEQGIHGKGETAAFNALQDFSADSAAYLSRLVLMQILPSLAEADILGFGQAITELQRVVGDHFASAQGGRFASTLVGEALTWFESEGAAGVGQSSWGPTGFAIVASAQEAERLVQKATARWPDSKQLSFMICHGKNDGASIIQEDLTCASVGLGA